MYEPIRTKSVHTMAAAPGIPHRSREEELDIRLAGQLTALLTVTDELHALATRAADPGADELDGPALAGAADRIAEQVARLSGGHYPLRAEPTDGGAPSRVPALQQRARTLAGNALAVATSRADTAVMRLATERMAAHTGPAWDRDLASA
ncbi:hypothetical protein SSP35_01_04980 [Streptomyces sp. NBRC 110611]|uniref:SCO4983 family protein n=1 Tax=Streptomyces sp. NBRC 110611 TaxID=1621259 RepID=UPI0008327B38|nr:hypothetical protein [Streptomyces sp. NBRC 110611]GAU65160.1 hypothetical protein SSP35_01_04980 [Streptomyces sp. NBRC 110611]